MLPPVLMAEIASDEVLDKAYLWLCDRRKDYSPNNDVWTLRWRWREVEPQVQQALLSGSYRFAAAGIVGVAKQTVERCVERVNRLYEQGADAVRIGDYVRRWRQWVRTGLDGYELAVVKPSPCAAADKLRQVPALPRPRARGWMDRGPAERKGRPLRTGGQSHC